MSDHEPLQKRTAEEYFRGRGEGALSRWNQLGDDLSWGAFFVRAGAPRQASNWVGYYQAQKKIVETPHKQPDVSSSTLGSVVAEARSRGQKNVLQLVVGVGAGVGIYFAIKNGSTLYIALAAVAIFLDLVVALGRGIHDRLHPDKRYELNCVRISNHPIVFNS